MEQVLEYRKRKAKPKFYADENLPIAIVKRLRGMGVQVLTAHQVGLSGHPDENHTALALRHGYILLTCDRDYLDEGRFPLIHCPAIVVFDFGSGSLGEVQGAFIYLHRMFRLPQFFDKWAKVHAKPDSWIEYKRYLDGTTARLRLRVHWGRYQEWVDR